MTRMGADVHSREEGRGMVGPQPRGMVVCPGNKGAHPPRLTSCKEKGEEGPSDANVQSKEAFLRVAPGLAGVESLCCSGNVFLQR